MKCEAGGSGSLIATLAIIFVLIIKIKENFQYSILKSRRDQQFWYILVTVQRIASNSILKIEIVRFPRKELIPAVDLHHTYQLAPKLVAYLCSYEVGGVKDVRRTFLDHLYKALCDVGINVFKDDELPRGEDISRNPPIEKNYLIALYLKNSFLHVESRASSGDSGLVALQEKLLRKRVEVSSVDHGIQLMSSILDGVVDLKQIYSLVGGKNWFGPGSRIIITTRGQTLADSFSLGKLSIIPSLPPEDFVELSESVVTHAQGLPLGKLSLPLPQEQSDLRPKSIILEITSTNT
uniref:NB-ARC domain-containing protein n=1 Tax=Solanum lycopersicum TaxID=4081 RepID=A0A3Q7JK14_SOLLC